MVLGIVRTHGGAITVASELGRGSTFQLFLPVSLQKAGTSFHENVETLTIEPDCSILIAEDEDMLRKMMATMLTSMGMRPIQARNGSEAVDIFQQHPEIRCVLTDLTMPDMNGWDVISAVKSIRPNIPVILASGYDEGYVMAAHHENSPQAFLHKPYTMMNLRSALAKTIGVKNPC